MNIRKFESFFNRRSSGDIYSMGYGNIHEMMEFMAGQYRGVPKGNRFMLPALSTGDQMTVIFSDGVVRVQITGGLMRWENEVDITELEESDIAEYREDAAEYSHGSEFVNFWRAVMDQAGMSTKIEEYEGLYEEDVRILQDRITWMQETGMIALDKIDKIKDEYNLR